MSRGAEDSCATNEEEQISTDGADGCRAISSRCSVGDADNFRFWHQPTLRPWAKPPNKKSGQSGRGRPFPFDPPPSSHPGFLAKPLDRGACP